MPRSGPAGGIELTVIDILGPDDGPHSHRRPLALLLLFALVLFLPGFATLPPMDRDEPRFAQASKQMLETGDLVAIRFQDEARNKKPVGIYWMQIAAVRAGELLGIPDAPRRIWLYRVPSLLGALAAVLGTYWAALAMTGRQDSFVAALLLASTVLLNVEARLAKTDAVLLATVVFAMGALARVVLTPDRVGRWREPAVFWTAIAVGVLVKGPITPMVALFTTFVVAVRDRSVGWVRPLRLGPGLLWVLVLALPWFALILLRTHGSFLADSVGHDMLGKVAGGQESHGAPPGTYLAAFWLTAWPIAPFAVAAIPLAWRRRREPAIAFLLAWLVPAWLLFEAVPSKLPHYVLPTYPAIAILIAVLLGRAAARPVPWWVRAFTLGLASLLPIALVVALLKGRGLLWDSLPAAVLVGGVAVAVSTTAGLAWVDRRRLEGALLPAALGSGAAAALFYSFVLGVLLAPAASTRLAVSPRLAEAARTALEPGCPEGGAVASAASHEPSLVFLTGTGLALVDPSGAAAFLKGGECRVALVDRRQEPGFLQVLGTEPDIHLAGRVEGTALNGLKPLDIGIYVRQRTRP